MNLTAGKNARAQRGGFSSTFLKAVGELAQPLRWRATVGARAK